MSEIFVTSDLHLGHDKSFIWGKRGFSDVRAMDEAIIERWNSLIDPGDIVYCLGDLIVGGNDYKEIASAYLPLLNGNIFLVRGNHDSEDKIKAYCQTGKIQEVAMGYDLKYSNKKQLLLTHYPTIVCNDPDPRKNILFNLCGHIHTQDHWLHWNYGCYHVELDACDCYPMNLDDIMQDIQQKLS